MEGSIRDSIGPEYGFDLHRIGDHYKFFRDLRDQYAVLRDGLFLPLHVKPQTTRVASFCRYGEGEMFIVLTSFDSEPASVSLSLDELLIPIHWMGNHTPKDTGLWDVHYIRNDTRFLVRGWRWGDA